MRPADPFPSGQLDPIFPHDSHPRPTHSVEVVLDSEEADEEDDEGSDLEPDAEPVNEAGREEDDDEACQGDEDC